MREALSGSPTGARGESRFALQTSRSGMEVRCSSRGAARKREDSRASRSVECEDRRPRLCSQLGAWSALRESWRAVGLE